MYKHFSNAKCLGTKFARKFCPHFKKNEMRTKCAKMLYEYCTNFVRFLSPRAGTRDEHQKRVTIQLASANLETRPAFGPSRPSRGAVPKKRSEYRRHRRFLLPREGCGLGASKRRPAHAYSPAPNVHTCTLGMPYCMDWTRSVTTTAYMKPRATTAYLAGRPNIK